ncbi:MAG: zinc ribbon domain-containing protein, partial [Eubacteriales bacterium]|nr:zinc ribbon domain-containing protein [Eubacteriales bacterium]
FAGNNSIHLIDAEKNNAAHVSATEGTIHQQSVTREVSAEFRASDLQAAQSLAQLGYLDRQRTTWKPSRDLTAILIAGLSVLVLSALIVLIVLLVRKHRNRTHLPPAPRTEQIRPVRVFCPDCGGENEAGHSYCEHCGHRLQ